MSTDAAVTVAVSRTIRSGQEAEARAWVGRAIAIASRAPGHQGAFVVDQGPSRFTLVFRFASSADLQAWEAGAERAALLVEVEPLTEAVTVQRLEGMEPFFALPGVPAPPKWKMAVVTWLVAFPTIQCLQTAFSGPLTNWHPLARGALLGALMVITMTWLAMPAATRALRRWLTARPAPTRPSMSRS